MGVLAEHVIQFRALGAQQVEASIGRLKSSLGGLGSAATAPLRSLGGAITSVLNPANILQGMGLGIGMSLTQGIGSGIKSAVGLAAQVETLSTSFEVLLGSAGSAKKMMEDINKFAAATPFEQMELGAAAKQLLAYGVASQNIIPTMRQLGDIAALSGAPLQDLVSIFGKIKGQGKLTAETLEQFSDRAIPVVRQLAEQFGVSEAQIRQMVSEGKIGFADVQAALTALTSEGGQFAGGMEKLSQTTGGLWSTVTGNFKTALAELGQGLISIFNVKGALALLGNWLDGLAERIKSFFQGVRVTLDVFVNNWRLAFSIGLEYFRLVLREQWRLWQVLFQNIGIALKWFFNNWRDIFKDIWNVTQVTMTNLFDNLRKLWTAFWDWIKTGDWRMDWTPLTEGFKSSIQEWPQFVDMSVNLSSDKLTRLTDEWKRKWADASAAMTAGTEEATTPAKAAASVASGAAAPAAQAASGGIRGTGATFVGFAELAKQMQQKAFEDMQKKAAEAAQQTAKGIERIAAAASGGTLKVQVVGGAVATYG